MEDEQKSEHEKGITDYYVPIEHNPGGWDFKKNPILRHKFISVQYFRNNNFWYDSKTTSTKKIPRLTLFSGGCVTFPYKKEIIDEIYKAMAIDIEANNQLPLNQIAYDLPEEGCRLAIDIDSERIITKEEILQFSKILYQTLKRYFTDFEKNPIPIFVSQCGPRLKKGKESVGLHIITHVAVTIEQALQIIFAYEIDCFKDGMKLSGIEIDSKIYKTESKTCSLRPVFCHKYEDCPVCENDQNRRMSCLFCKKDGKVVPKLTYEPCIAVNPKTGKCDPAYYFEQCPQRIDVIRNYSLWPYNRDIEFRSDYKKPETDISYDSEDVQTNEKKKVSSKKKKFLENQTSIPKERKSDVISPDDPVWGLLEKEIQELCVDKICYWDRAMMNSISKYGKTGFFISISGHTSSNCPYAKKDHNGNRLYFILRKNGDLSVHCNSKKHGCVEKCKHGSNELIKLKIQQKIMNKLLKIDGPPASMSFLSSKNVTESVQTSNVNYGNLKLYNLLVKDKFSNDLHLLFQPKKKKVKSS